MQTVSTDFGSHSTVTSALKRAMIQAAGERDYSAQETAHLLLSLPLYSCTFKFVTINLNGDREVRARLSELQPDQPATIPSLMNFYSQHSIYEQPELLSLNLIEFVSTYTIYNGNLTHRSNPVTVKLFQCIMPIQGDPITGNYLFTANIS